MIAKRRGDVLLKMGKETALEDLREIPGVGEKIAGYLHHIGIQSVEDLRGRDPEELYFRLCARAGRDIDRCLLYVLRCSVYYASNSEHDSDLLKWWNWTDERMPV